MSKKQIALENKETSKKEKGVCEIVASLNAALELLDIIYNKFLFNKNGEQQFEQKFSGLESTFISAVSDPKILEREKEKINLEKIDKLTNELKNAQSTLTNIKDLTQTIEK
jgi:hypothetical protein